MLMDWNLSTVDSKKLPTYRSNKLVWAALIDLRKTLNFCNLPIIELSRRQLVNRRIGVTVGEEEHVSIIGSRTHIL